MELVVGVTYYYLSQSQYNDLQNSGYDGEDGLLNDFQLGPGGFYWATLDSISPDEYEFLLENELLQSTVYSKSTQPGAGM